jgi:hypothetical protein
VIATGDEKQGHRWGEASIRSFLLRAASAHGLRPWMTGVVENNIAQQQKPELPHCRSTTHACPPSLVGRDRDLQPPQHAAGDGGERA